MDAITTQALALPERDRIALVERLLDSLGPASDTLNEDAFRAEITRRSDEVDQGTAELIPWSELKRETW